MYHLSKQLPESERFNLRSQVERAATSVVLNIAEGSTSQSDAEQARFLGMALRSLLETVSCWDLVERRGYVSSNELTGVREQGHTLIYETPGIQEEINLDRRPTTGDQGKK